MPALHPFSDGLSGYLKFETAARVHTLAAMDKSSLHFVFPRCWLLLAFQVAFGRFSNTVSRPHSFAKKSTNARIFGLTARPA